MSDFISYHGTTKTNADDIILNGFYDDKPSLKERSNKKYPNDLGYGVYSFIDADDMNFDSPIENAKKYPVYQKRCQKNDVAVVKIEGSVDENNVLDFNHSENINRFIDLKRTVQNAVELKLGEYRNNSARQRGIIDGAVLEYCFQHGLIPKVDAIIKDSYTPFDGIQSKFPNGREFVIRNFSIINNKNLL